MQEIARPLRTLIVEDDPADALLVQETLMIQASDFSVVLADSLAGCRQHLAAGHFDVVLLDLNLPDSRGVTTLQTVLLEFPDVPVLVFTGLNDHYAKQAAMAAGAQDYLDKGQLQTVLLGRVIRYAVERFARLRALDAENRRAELAALASLAGLPPHGAAASTTTNPIAADGTLRASHPVMFAALSSQLTQILDQSLRHRFYKNARSVSGDLLTLAGQIGALEGGPRDVVDLYTGCVRIHLDRVGSRTRAQATLEESRLLLLELMGDLASFYRQRAYSPPSGVISEH